MKLLSKKECDEVLKRVTACQIIANEYVKDIEAFDKIAENLADISISIGDCMGASKVQNTVRKYNNKLR